MLPGPPADGAITDNQTTVYTYGGDDGTVCPVYRKDLLIKVKYPDGDDTNDNVQMTYYADGSLKTRTDQRGTVHTFEYTTTGQLAADKVTATGTGVDDAVLRIETAYDDAQRPSTVTSYDAATAGTAVNQIEYTYGSWGAVTLSEQAHTGEVGGGTPAVAYTYEALGGANAKNVRLQKVGYPGASREVYYNYPASGIGAALNRLDNLADDAGGTTKYAQYSYLGTGTIVKVAHPAVSGGLNLTYGDSPTYSGFDKFGRVIDQTWQTDTPTVKDRIRYGYDRAGNRLWRKPTLASSKDEYYTYDDLNRLTAYGRGTLTGADPAFTGIDTASDVRREAWQLTQTGNWTTWQLDANADDDVTDATDYNQARTFNAVNELYHATPGSAIQETGGQTAWVDPTYDDAGNMISGPKPGDGTTRLHYVYDAWNRLVKVYQDDGDGTLEAGGDDTHLTTYEYDGLKRMIRRTVEGDPDVVYDYYYNTGWQVLEIRRDTDTDPYQQFVWDQRYIDAPVVRFTDGNTDGDLADTGDDTDHVLYYTNDANMNVTALVNTSGSVVERYLYDAYGRLTVLNGEADRDDAVNDWSNDADNTSDWDNDLLYCGYRYDPVVGLYHVRHRVYDAELGRWHQRDPLGYVDGMGLYEYVRTAPLEHNDPFGTQAAPNIPMGTNQMFFDEMGYPHEHDTTTLYLINRGGPKGQQKPAHPLLDERTGGHIDLANVDFPGTGLVGFYGEPNGEGARRVLNVLQGIPGYMNTTLEDWRSGPTPRESYIQDKVEEWYDVFRRGRVWHVRYTNRRGIPGRIITRSHRSWICAVPVCKWQAKKMAAEVARIVTDPGKFMLSERNCSHIAARILKVGQVCVAHARPMNPQAVMEQCGKGGECYWGRTYVRNGRIEIVKDNDQGPTDPRKERYFEEDPTLLPLEMPALRFF